MVVNMKLTDPASLKATGSIHSPARLNKKRGRSMRVCARRAFYRFDT